MSAPRYLTSFPKLKAQTALIAEGNRVIYRFVDLSRGLDSLIPRKDILKTCHQVSLSLRFHHREQD